MITANDVLSVLCSNYDTSDHHPDELIPCCELGLSFVYERLKPGVSPFDPLITETAAAVAHYHFFLRAATETEKYENYRVGDLSITNNPSKALEREIRVRDEALARANSILQDGGFYCHAN